MLRYFVFLLYLIIAIRVNALMKYQVRKQLEDLQDSSLTISGTLDGNLNNIVRGYTAPIGDGNEIDNATVVVESGGVIQGLTTL